MKAFPTDEQIKAEANTYYYETYKEVFQKACAWFKEQQLTHVLVEQEIEALDLKKRSDIIDLLEKYSMFLEKGGYLDTDWRNEPPFAIDEFLKSLL